MLAPTKRLEYLEARPRPANAPTASHQLGWREAYNSARAHPARPQKRTEGVSGVMMTPPTARSGMARASHTARRAAAPGPRMMTAVRHRAAGPMREIRMAAKRMPRLVSPAIHRPAAIIHP